MGLYKFRVTYIHIQIPYYYTLKKSWMANYIILPNFKSSFEES